MYATCLHCHAALGANEALETFPVGRRLAFDAAKGRLWVVCGRCGRWNLSPLEERWEAIEACERLYRDTRTRVATDEIGLARLREGLELVRIGAPLRPEFAAWRYGAEFARRQVRDLARAVGIGVGGTVAMVGGTVASFAAATAIGSAALVAGPALFVFVVGRASHRELHRTVARLPAHRVRTPEAPTYAPFAVTATVRDLDLRSVRVLAGASGLRVRTTSTLGWVELEGEPAAHVATLACARRNRSGAGPRAVADAVRAVETAGGSAALLHGAAREARALRDLRYVERLAFEMALHEDGERRALEGELQRLHDAWRRAEEIAAIADDLLLPPRVHALLRRHRDASRDA